MSTLLLLFMLITKCQCLSPARLYFVLSSAANHSNILQPNEVPYVPEFLSLHSKLQTYFMISELTWTKQVLHHMPSGSISEFYGYKWVTQNFLCIISRVQAGTYRAKARNESGSTSEKSPLKVLPSLPSLLSPIISLSLRISKTKSLTCQEERQRLPYFFLYFFFFAF